MIASQFAPCSPALPWTVPACRSLARELGLVPRKSLGQCFLPVQELLDRIASAASVTPGDRVLEIGPGLGHLTARLLDLGANVCAMELDPRLAAHLRGAFAEPLAAGRLGLLEGDALDGPHRLSSDLARWLAEQAREGGPGVKVVSNLPYSIASPLLVLLLKCAAGALQAPGVERIVACVQAEVADRILAPPGTRAYGPLSVQIAYRGKVERCFDVAPGCFWPRPAVHSTVLRIVPRPPAPAAADEALFGLVVRAAFHQRRKTLANSLARSPFLSAPEGQDRSWLAGQATAWLFEARLPASLRGDQLDLDLLVGLANRLAAAGTRPGGPHPGVVS